MGLEAVWGSRYSGEGRLLRGVGGFGVESASVRHKCVTHPTPHLSTCVCTHGESESVRWCCKNQDPGVDRVQFHMIKRSHRASGFADVDRLLMRRMDI